MMRPWFRHRTAGALCGLIAIRLSPLLATAGLAVALIVEPAAREELFGPFQAGFDVSATSHFAGIVIISLDASIGGAALLRRLQAGRSLARCLRYAAVAPSPKLLSSAAAASVGAPLTQFADDESFAFTYGLLRPRIAISSALVRQLSLRDLTAVLAHERSHVEGRDPLRVIAVASFSRGLLCGAVLPLLLDCHLQRRELVADRAAIRAAGKSALVQALLATTKRPTRGLVTAHMGSDSNLLEARVAHLESGHTPCARPTRRHVVDSLPALVLFVALFFTCGH